MGHKLEKMYISYFILTRDFGKILKIRNHFLFLNGNKELLIRLKLIYENFMKY